MTHTILSHAQVGSETGFVFALGATLIFAPWNHATLIPVPEDIVHYVAPVDASMQAFWQTTVIEPRFLALTPQRRVQV